jgi:hypothetical protein
VDRGLATPPPRPGPAAVLVVAGPRTAVRAPSRRRRGKRWPAGTEDGAERAPRSCVRRSAMRCGRGLVVRNVAMAVDPPRVTASPEQRCWDEAQLGRFCSTPGSIDCCGLANGGDDGHAARRSARSAVVGRRSRWLLSGGAAHGELHLTPADVRGRRSEISWRRQRSGTGDRPRARHEPHEVLGEAS